MDGNPLSYSDPLGLNPVGRAYAGAGVVSVFGLVGIVVGGVVGAGIGAAIGWDDIGSILTKSGNESRPIDAPSGTKSIGQSCLSRGDVYDIKGGVGAGARD